MSLISLLPHVKFFYLLMPGNAVQVLVASHTETLLVYHETELRWASQLPFVPVALTRANFEVGRL